GIVTSPANSSRTSHRTSRGLTRTSVSPASIHPTRRTRRISPDTCNSSTYLARSTALRHPRAPAAVAVRVEPEERAEAEVPAAPGTGTSPLTIAASANTRPQDYRVLLSITGNGVTSYNSIKVSVLCDPPFILGVDEPQNPTINRGATATLEAKPTGSGPFLYQW